MRGPNACYVEERQEQAGKQADAAVEERSIIRSSCWPMLFAAPLYAFTGKR